MTHILRHTCRLLGLHHSCTHWCQSLTLVLHIFEHAKDDRQKQLICLSSLPPPAHSKILSGRRKPPDKISLRVAVNLFPVKKNVCVTPTCCSSKNFTKHPLVLSQIRIVCANSHNLLVRRENQQPFVFFCFELSPKIFFCTMF
jgi:hypothetical protein